MKKKIIIPSIMILLILTAILPVVSSLNNEKKNRNIIISEDCEPCMEVEKEIFDPVIEQWVEEADTCQYEEALWRIKISNCGNCQLTTISVSDLLDEGLTYIANSATPFEPYISNPRNPFWGKPYTTPLEPIPIGSYLVITFKTTCNEIGKLVNHVKVDGSCDCGRAITQSDSACVNVKELTWTSCGIINQVSTYPNNWNDPNALTIITFKECNGDAYTLYGPPSLEANNENINLSSYKKCNYARYGWCEENGKKIIKKWETNQSSDPGCDDCCSYCCLLDFSFLGSPFRGSGGGGGGGGGPPSLCPGQYKTYRYSLKNNCGLDIMYSFENPNPAPKITFDPQSDYVLSGEEKIIYVYYKMPGHLYNDCHIDSCTYTHELHITIMTNPTIECTPIESSVFIKCRNCSEISGCDDIGGLYSGPHMQMQQNNDWVQINTINFNQADDSTWNPHFKDIDNELHENCNAEWIYGNRIWNKPKKNKHEYYRLNFTIPSGKSYAIAFTACIDDEARFELKAPGMSNPTEFFKTDLGTGIYSNFYAYYENQNNERVYCLPSGKYTLYIDHWDTGGVRYGMIFATTTCKECGLKPDLECSGTISWTKVNPGSTVTDTFQVLNNGETDSLLNWRVKGYPSAWGEWTFTPESGTNLKPSHGPAEVEVKLIAPDIENEHFSGNIKIENIDDPSDYEYIPVSLKTPKTKEKTINTPFLKFLENYPIIYQLIQRILKL